MTGEARLWDDTAAVAASMAVGGLAVLGQSRSFGRAWRMYGVATLLWAGGSLLWAVGGAKTTGILAMVAAALAVLALLLAMADLTSAFAVVRRFTVLDMAMVAVVAAAAMYRVLGLTKVAFGPGFGWQAYTEAVALAATAFLFANSVYRHRHSGFGPVGLCAGALCVLASEIGYTVSAAMGHYAPGSVVELGWFVGPFFMVVATNLSLNHPIREHKPVQVKGWLWAIGPVLAMGALVLPGSANTSLAWRLLVLLVPVLAGMRVFAHHRDLEAKVAARTREMHHLVYMDSVSGIANRRFFTQATADSLKEATGLVAMVFIDLDDFKAINDTLGHSYGDVAVNATATAISKAVRKGDIVARMGGDEFAVFLPSLTSQEEASQVAQRCLDAVHGIHLSANAIGITHIKASCGVTVHPAWGTNVKTLLQEADLAMYQAKTKGDCVVVFEVALAERQMRRTLLDAQLAPAFAKGELSLYYQPIVDMATGKPVEFEALLRWLTPQGTPVAGPEEIVRAAERSGLISALSGWVLHQALTDAISWDLPVAVNLSAFDMHDSLPALVADVLATTGAPPGNLVVELTETHLVEPSELTLSVLRHLRRCGVRISLDDFGTGYSSLSALASLPVDQVKLDRSFVLETAKDDRTLLVAGAVVNLADKLDLAVVAEGIETQEQWACFAKVGVGYGQGYLFGKPMPAKEVTALLGAKCLCP